jgi:hypothetical protein
LTGESQRIHVDRLKQCSNEMEDNYESILSNHFRNIGRLLAIVLILTSGGCLGAQAPATPLPPNTWASLGPEG